MLQAIVVYSTAERFLWLWTQWQCPFLSFRITPWILYLSGPNFSYWFYLTIKLEHCFFYRQSDQLIYEVMETVFGGQSREEIHADSPCRALYKKQPLGEKERITDGGTGRTMHVGPFSLYTQVLPSVLPGLPSLGDLTAARRTRGTEEDVSSN